MIRHALLSIALFVCFLCPALAQPTTIFLVRHAEKESAGGSKNKNPDLSRAGRARAATLAAMCKDARLTAIYATEFKRTQQTAKPLADAAHLKITTVPEKKTPALIAKLQKARGNVLVVGHSNTLPEIITALGADARLTIAENDYDNLFLLLPGAPVHLLRLHFK